MRISDWSSDVCSSDLLCDRLVEQAAGGADEGPALYILLIARLFAHQHDARRRRPLARHPLRRVAIERAAGAAVDRADKVVQRFERSGGVGHGMSFLRRTNGREPPSVPPRRRSEEHTSELQSLMRISYAVFCLKKKTH